MMELLLLSGEPPVIEYTYSLVSLADRPIAASHVSLGAANGKIYAIGGLNNSTRSVNNFNIYDVASNTWSSGPVLPQASRSGIVGAYNNYVFHLGGFDQGGTNTYSGSTRAFNISTNTWQTGVVTSTRSDSAYVTTAGGALYIFGGYNGSNVNLTDRFDISTGIPGSVTALTATTNIRLSGCIYDGNGNFYLAGGVNAAGAAQATFKRFHLLSGTGTWETLAPLPTVSNSVYLIMWDRKVFALTANNGSEYINNLYSYDPITNTWTDRGAVPGIIHGITTSVVYNNELYLVGGYNGTTRIASVSKLTRTPIPK